MRYKELFLAKNEFMHITSFNTMKALGNVQTN